MMIETALSQTINYNTTDDFISSGKELIIGEADTIGMFNRNDGFPCSVSYQGQRYTHYPNDPNFVTWDVFEIETNYSIIRGQGFYIPTKIGVFYDTLYYGFNRVSISGSCFGGSYVSRVIGKYTVRNDSLVRTRPTYTLLNMLPDSSAGGWSGGYTFQIDNNTNDTVRFSNFRIRKDSLRNVSVIVKDSGNTIMEITLLPYQRWKTLSAEITSQRGPVYQDTTIRSVVSCTVSTNGKDTVHNILTDLKYKAAPYSFTSVVSSKLASFSTSPNNIDSVVLSLKDDSKTSNRIISITSHPFSFRIDSISKLENRVVILCKPVTGGIYIDTLKVYYDVADFNGDLRKDSLSVLLTCTSSSDNDKSEWQSTHYPVPFAKQLAVTSGGIILAEGAELLLSKDFGLSWSQVLVPDGSTPQLNIVNDSIYVYGASKLMVTTNSGITWADHSDSVGRLIRSAFYYDKYYYSKLPIHHIAATKLGSIVVTGEGLGYFDHYRCYYFEWVARQFDPIGNRWQTIGSKTGDCIHYNSTPSIKENILYLESQGKTHYIFNEKFSISPSCYAISLDSVHYCFVKDKGVYRSTNNRYSWTKTGLILKNVVSMVASDGGSIYIATKDNGLYHSSDYGENWYGMNGGLGTRFINDLKSYPGEPLYIATYSGVYRSILTTPKLSTPKNYASPTNELTAIPNPATDKLAILLPDDVVVIGGFTVYDIYGRSIIKGNATRQGSLIQMDVHDVANGVYFVHIPTAVGVKTAKFSVNK